MCEMYGIKISKLFFSEKNVRYPDKNLEVELLRLTSFAPSIPPREACWESSDPDFPVQSGKELPTHQKTQEG